MILFKKLPSVYATFISLISADREYTYRLPSGSHEASRSSNPTHLSLYRVSPCPCQLKKHSSSSFSTRLWTQRMFEDALNLVLLHISLHEDNVQHISHPSPIVVPQISSTEKTKESWKPISIAMEISPSHPTVGVRIRVHIES